MGGMGWTHPIHHVTGFAIVAPYTLQVLFEDGVSHVIDLSGVLEGEMFGPLKDISLFNQVAIDPEFRTLVWPNGADFDPATLHDWPEVAEEMRAMAAKWRKPPTSC